MLNIKNLKLFADLDDDSLASISDQIHWHRHPRDTVLFSNGELTSDVYFVGEGIVRATAYSFSGKEVAYQDLTSGEMFGELSAIDHGPRTTGIVVVEDALIGKISSSVFWHIVETYPAVMHAVMYRLSGLVRFLIDRVYENATMGVSDRVRAEIVRHARKQASGKNSALISDLPTHEQLASKLTTHREAVTREIGYLAREGYIEKAGRKIRVPDIEKLVSLIEEYV